MEELDKEKEKYIMSIRQKYNLNCNICGSNHYKIMYQNKKANEYSSVNYKISESDLIKPNKIVKCFSCGLVYSENILSKRKELRENYKNMSDEQYTEEEQGRRILAKKVLNFLIRKKPKKGKLLDIGCSAGFFLDEAQKIGWDTAGVELSSWACSYATQKLKLSNIFNKELKEATFENSSFDVIVLMDVLEHLADPKTILLEIKRILKPEGILYLSIPDIGSILSKLLKFKWWGINYSHLYYFDKNTITILLKQIGFGIKSTKREGRFFSISYLIYRSKKINNFISIIILFFANIFSIKNKIVKINLFDQLHICSERIRDIDYVKEKESFEKVQKNSKKIARNSVVAVLPAYNAEATLKITVDDIPKDLVDDIIVVDDASSDNTYELAKDMGLIAIQHKDNKGYGGNQKTCYDKALEKGADIVVMIHPDYQYDPTIIKKMIDPIRKGNADVVFASRMMKGGSLEGGMPLWKHNTNIILTALANIVFHKSFTEYHSGFRAFSKDVLNGIDYHQNKDNFVFDFEIISQIVANHYKIEEIPIQTRYFEGASSIKMIPAIIYGLGILKILCQFWIYDIFNIMFKRFK